MTRLEYENKIGTALRKRFTYEQMEDEFEEIMSTSFFDNHKIEEKARMYLLACGVSEQDRYVSAQYMGYAYFDVSLKKYKEKDLINAVNDIIKKIKLFD